MAGLPTLGLPHGALKKRTSHVLMKRTCCELTTEEMREKEPKLAPALKRGALPGDSYAGWHGNQVALGGALIAGGVGEIPRQQTPVLAALVQVHIHDLEGHVLRAVIADQRGGLQVPHADRQLQLHLRSWREVAADGCHAPAQTGGLDFQ